MHNVYAPLPTAALCRDAALLLGFFLGKTLARARITALEDPEAAKGVRKGDRTQNAIDA